MLTDMDNGIPQWVPSRSPQVQSQRQSPSYFVLLPTPCYYLSISNFRLASLAHCGPDEAESDHWQPSADIFEDLAKMLVPNHY